MILATPRPLKANKTSARSLGSYVESSLTLYGIGIGHAVTKLNEFPMNTNLAAMSVTNLDLHHPLPTPLFNHLHMRLSPARAVLWLREATPLASSRRAVGCAKDLRKERLVTRFAITKEHHSLRIAESVVLLSHDALCVTHGSPSTTVRNQSTQLPCCE